MSVTPAADPARLPEPPRPAADAAAPPGPGRPRGARRGRGQRRAARQQLRGRRELAAAIQRHVAAGRQRLPRQIGGRAGQRLHRQIVGHQNSFKADPAADDRLDHGRGQCRRQRGIPGRIDDVRRHGPGQVGVQGERQQIGIQIVGLDARQRQMAVHPRAAMPGRMLADRLHARRRAAPRRSAVPAARPRAGSSASARSPITAWAPGTARSSTGAATTSKPAAAQSRPISAPVSQAARRPAQRRPPADARASAAAAGARPGRPPDPPSAPRRPAGRGAGRRSARQAAPGDWMLRANRMTPHGGCAAEQRGLIGRQRRPGDADDGGLQKSATEQPAPLARTRLAERGGLRRVGEPAGAHAPQRVAVVFDLAECGLRWPSRSGRRLDRRCHSDLRRVLGPHRGELHQCTARRRRRCGCLSGAAAGFAATGFGRCWPATGAGAGQVQRMRRRRRRAIGGGAVRRCAHRLRCRRLRRRRQLAAFHSLPPDRMSSLAPATCMPPGFSGFTRIGRLSACTTGTVRAAMADQRPAADHQHQHAAKSAGDQRQAARVAGSMPRRWRGMR